MQIRVGVWGEAKEEGGPAPPSTDEQGHASLRGQHYPY